MDSKLNKNGGTLIFSMHYPELLDEYDRSDSIYITRNRNGITAENAVMDTLLDNELLFFSGEEMLEGEVIRCREGRRFEERYLRKGFDDKISIIRILDSRRENFKLSRAYEHKVDVINVITAPL